MKTKCMRRFFALRQRDPRKRAAAVVEFAVVLPLLLTILFGIIEFGWVFMVRQTLQTAAREGCRVAVLPSSVAPYTNVTTIIDSMMASTGLTPSQYSVVMTHAAPGVSDIETVEISVPRSDISLVGSFFGATSGTVYGTCAMRKEGI